MYLTAITDFLHSFLILQFIGENTTSAENKKKVNPLTLEVPSYYVNKETSRIAS